MTSVEALAIRLLEQITPLTSSADADADAAKPAATAPLQPAVVLQALTANGFDLTAAVVALHHEH